MFITNNNPRLESPEDIVSQTIAGFPPHIHAYEVLNQQQTPHRQSSLRLNAPAATVHKQLASAPPITKVSTFHGKAFSRASGFAGRSRCRGARTGCAT